MTLDGLTTYMLSPTVSRIYRLPTRTILCFDRTTYDNINSLGGPFMFDIIGLITYVPGPNIS